MSRVEFSVKKGAAPSTGGGVHTRPTAIGTIKKKKVLLQKTYIVGRIGKSGQSN